jgi:hypothetical protein
MLIAGQNKDEAHVISVAFGNWQKRILFCKAAGAWNFLDIRIVLG